MVAGAPEGWRTTLDKLEQEVLRMSGAPERASVTHGGFQLERHYDASVDRVWTALTDPAAKQKWFVGPPGEWELLERQMDVRAGGRERVRGRFKSGVVSTFDASYHDVVRHERLVYTYVMSMDDRKISVSLATMQIKAENHGSRSPSTAPFSTAMTMPAPASTAPPTCWTGLAHRSMTGKRLAERRYLRREPSVTFYQAAPSLGCSWWRPQPVHQQVDQPMRAPLPAGRSGGMTLQEPA
jgi:uncharacterized protein YndB with AHSA1/START domain